MDSIDTKDFYDDSVEVNNKKSFKPLRSFLIYFLIIVGIYALFNICFFNAEVPTSSMENTIYPGDRLLGIRFFGEVNRGDIVIFYSAEERKYLVKRVIGIPGDEIDIKEGYVYINGSILEEPYLKLEAQTYPYDLEVPTVVPEGKYFLMGDNRTNSQDSRFWEETFVGRDIIEAKVIFRYFPFNYIGVIK